VADLRWALYRSAAYLRGRGVTFGSPLIPQLAVNEGIYSIPVGLVKTDRSVALDQNLDIFADQGLDHVLLTGMIGGLQEPAQMIGTASRKLKKNGHLIILTDINDTRPGVATIQPKDVEEWVSNSGKWVRKAQYNQDGKNLQIFKRIEGRRGFIDLAKPDRKRCLVVRYGALGDAIVMSPLIHAIHDDGYHLTLAVNPYCLAALENNPYIDNLIIQEKDVVPNPLLGEYWRLWEKEYDKFVNLSESIEGDLLQVEPRPSFFTTKEWRHEKGNKNYYDFALARGGYSHITGKRGELFFTSAEERKAKKVFTPLQDKFVIVWALNGSSHHKVFPYLELVLRQWFKDHEDSIVITTGDYAARLMEFEHPQLLPRAGEWSIRESLIATKYADLVVGPETMMTNAAGCFATPKICLLSHSTKENLTKYWENDYSLEPDVAIAQCYPCHQLHYTKESCPAGQLYDSETGEEFVMAPKCTLAIRPERVLEQMQKVYDGWKNARLHTSLQHANS
jgi:ADP-heptose:LPS heptosyltransferase